MPCDSRLAQGQTLQQRMDQVHGALGRLERALQSGLVKIMIAPNGAISFQGWKDRDGVNDACAFRSLTAKNSFALKLAIQKAEATSGRKVNQQAVAAGVHSHDGGRTFHGGH